MNYGGRGIKVCDSWRRYENFLADVGRAPTKDHSLDRIDPDGNYEKSNCRWATPKVQGRNKRSHHLVTIGQERKCVADWAEQAGIPYGTLLYRIRTGWSGADLLLPVRNNLPHG
jgi:hypothetical protein